MKYLIGALAGLAWGAAVSVINYLIIKSSLKKQNTNGLLGSNLARNAVDVAALAVVFLLRKSLPFSFEAALIATAVTLSALTILLSFRLSKKL